MIPVPLANLALILRMESAILIDSARMASDSMTPCQGASHVTQDVPNAQLQVVSALTAWMDTIQTQQQIPAQRIVQVARMQTLHQKFAWFARLHAKLASQTITHARLVTTYQECNTTYFRAHALQDALTFSTIKMKPTEAVIHANLNAKYVSTLLTTALCATLAL